MNGSSRLTVTVHGKVQGVFFRAFVYDHALARGLTGYTRNMPDGQRVEVVAEGDTSALQELVDLLKKGPPAARVEKVAVHWGPASGEFEAFEVR